MAAYKIGFDERRGFLVCRVSGELGASEVTSLCSELIGALAATRARGQVRLLWDHRGLRVLPNDLADELLAVARDHVQPGDRAAILVSNSLDKVQGRPKIADQAAFFLSENAAYTWLRVGLAQAA